MQINFYFQRTPSKFLLDAVPTPEQPASVHALCSEQTHSSRVSLCWGKALNYVMKKNANALGQAANRSAARYLPRMRPETWTYKLVGAVKLHTLCSPLCFFQKIYWIVTLVSSSWQTQARFYTCTFKCKSSKGTHFYGNTGLNLLWFCTSLNSHFLQHHSFSIKLHAPRQ